MTPALRLQLLGYPQIFFDGDRVEDFVTTKAQILLIYLVMNPGIPQTRPRLAGMFWGTSPEEKALRSLRVVLSNLRKLFPDHLEITRQQVSFISDSLYWLDIDEFKENSGRDAGRIEEIERSVKLYRGDFLEGVFLDEAPEIEEWLLFEREDLRRRALSGLENLAGMYMRGGKFEEAQQTYRRLLALDPWKESAHRHLMLALARSGRFTAALTQYEECRKALAEELGVDPMPETIHLFRRIQAARQLPKRHNLPSQPTPFIGRVSKIREVERLLEDRETRLITIVGPGGIGKTRLALEAAAGQLNQYLHGVVFVPLDATLDVGQLHATLVETLGGNGFIPPLQGRRSPEEYLLDQLQNRELLLILDSFEHLVSSSTVIQKILENLEGVKILVTSRQRLGLHWERIASLKGLQVPQNAEEDNWERNEAVLLFLKSATRVSPGFKVGVHEKQAITEICRHVEGLPLALELAAVWVRVQHVVAIAKEITGNLDLLTSIHPDLSFRQRSIRAVFEHSWEFLSDVEKLAYAKLSVFVGSFTADAALRIANTEVLLLAALADRSLVHFESDALAGPPRYHLHALLRQFTGEKLRGDQDVLEDVRERFGRYYLGFLADKVFEIKEKGLQLAVEMLEHDFDNAMRAWRWAVQQRRVDLIDSAIEMLGIFFDTRGRYFEGLEVFSSAAKAFSGENKYFPIYARLLGRNASFARQLGDISTAEKLAKKSLAISEAEGVEEGKSFALLTLSVIYYDLGKYAEAEEFAKECTNYYLAYNHEGLAANGLNMLGLVQVSLAHESVVGDRPDAETWIADRFNDAIDYFERANELFRQSGNQRGEAVAVHNTGYIQYRQGLYSDAERSFRKSIEILDPLKNMLNLAQSNNWLGTVQAYQGQIQLAKESYHRALKYALDVGGRTFLMDTLYHYATNILLEENQIEEALGLLILVEADEATDARIRFGAEKDISDLSDQIPGFDLEQLRNKMLKNDVESVVSLLLK